MDRGSHPDTTVRVRRAEAAVIHQGANLMRIAGNTVLAFVLALSVTGRAAADDAAAIVERAIRATAGSAERLAKRTYCVHSDRGTMYFPAGAAPATRESHEHLPLHIKWVGECTLMGQKMPIAMALDGLKGWTILNGARADMPQSQYEVVQDEAYFLYVASLLPLREKGVTLGELKEALVGDQPARGVKVEARGRPTVQLYFDKANGLPVKGIYTVREVGREVVRETYFSDFKDFEGLRLPTKQVTFQAGLKTEEWTTERYRFPDKLDGAVFANRDYPCTVGRSRCMSSISRSFVLMLSTLCI
jgi:hypothetical protein